MRTTSCRGVRYRASAACLPCICARTTSMGLMTHAENEPARAPAKNEASWLSLDTDLFCAAGLFWECILDFSVERTRWSVFHRRDRCKLCVNRSSVGPYLNWMPLERKSAFTLKYPDSPGHSLLYALFRAPFKVAVSTVEKIARKHRTMKIESFVL